MIDGETTAVAIVSGDGTDIRCQSTSAATFNLDSVDEKFSSIFPPHENLAWSDRLVHVLVAGDVALSISSIVPGEADNRDLPPVGGNEARVPSCAA